MFIVLGDGTTVEKKEKRPSPIIYQAQDKYPDPSSHSRSKSKETPAKEDAHYLYGQNGKNPLETPQILSAKPEEIRPDSTVQFQNEADGSDTDSMNQLKPGNFQNNDGTDT